MLKATTNNILVFLCNKVITKLNLWMKSSIEKLQIQMNIFMGRAPHISNRHRILIWAENCTMASLKVGKFCLIILYWHHAMPCHPLFTAVNKNGNIDSTSICYVLKASTHIVKNYWMSLAPPTFSVRPII